MQHFVAKKTNLSENLILGFFDAENWIPTLETIRDLHLSNLSICMQQVYEQTE